MGMYVGSYLVFLSYERVRFSPKLKAIDVCLFAVQVRIAAFVAPHKGSLN